MTEQYDYWCPDVGWLASREQLGCPILHIILYCLHRWGVVTQGENIPRLGSYTSIMQYTAYIGSVLFCNLFVLLTFGKYFSWWLTDFMCVNIILLILHFSLFCMYRIVFINVDIDKKNHSILQGVPKKMWFKFIIEFLTMGRGFFRGIK